VRILKELLAMEAAVNFGQNPAKQGKNRNEGIFAL
jgi:hypothetical protein